MRILRTLAALVIAALAWHYGGRLGEYLGLEAFDPLPRLALLLVALTGLERVLTIKNGGNHAD